MDESYRNNAVIFPDDKLVAVSEPNMYHDETVQTLLESGWTRVRAA